MEPLPFQNRLLPKGLDLNLEATLTNDTTDRKNGKTLSNRVEPRSHRGSELSAKNPVLSFQNQERHHSVTYKTKGYQPFFRLKKKAFCFDNRGEVIQRQPSSEATKNKKFWSKNIETDNFQSSDISNCYNFLRLSNHIDPFSPDETDRPGHRAIHTEKGRKRPLNERPVTKASPKKPLRPSDAPRSVPYDDIPLKIFQPMSYTSKNAEVGLVISPQRTMNSSGTGRQGYFGRNGNPGFINLKKSCEMKYETSNSPKKELNQDLIANLINDLKHGHHVRQKKSISNGPNNRITHDSQQDIEGPDRSQYTAYNSFKNSSMYTKRETHTAGGHDRPHHHSIMQRSLTNDLESGTPTDRDLNFLRVSGVQKKIDDGLIRQKMAMHNNGNGEDKYSGWLFDKFVPKDMKGYERNILQSSSPESKDVILSQQQISLIFSQMKEYTMQQSLQIDNKIIKCSEDETITPNQNEQASPVGQSLDLLTVKNQQLRQSRRFQIKTQQQAQTISKEKKEEQTFLKNLELYQDFMLRINFSFNLVVKPPIEKGNFCYKYYLGQGNNNMLIRSLMKQRWWWSQTDKETGNVNFAWTQIKMNKFIESMKPRYKSTFESLENITNTQKSAGGPENKQSEITEEDSTSHALDVLFTGSELALLKTRSSNKFTAEDNEELCKLKKGSVFQALIDPTALKMCNHLENNFHLGNKKALLWNMRSYYESLKDNVFNYLPLTFHVQTGLEDPEFIKFSELYEKREKEASELTEEERKNMTKGRNIWIVKPGEDTNRGRGIKVCSNIAEIKDIINSSGGETTERNTKRTYLIQEYLTNPLLYNKRKFDIRCYFMISCINGIYKGYWYQEGYIRTTSKEFNLKNLHNKQVHLTNDAIQKKFDGYGKFEYGNKVSFTDFQKYLESHNGGKINFFTDIYPKIRKLGIDAIRAVYGKVDPVRREHCFEVFGLDFMIDTDLKAWLIEINTNPDITTTSPVLTKIIPSMVDNALRLALDPIFPPPGWPNAKRHLMPENLSENNKFELVFDEVQDGPSLKHLVNVDNDPTMGLIFEMEREQEEEVLEN